LAVRPPVSRMLVISEGTADSTPSADITATRERKVELGVNANATGHYLDAGHRSMVGYGNTLSNSRKVLTGTANPMPEPIAARALTTPTTRPLVSMSGPPELPGLIAASV
jgi:hypothetical protein